MAKNKNEETGVILKIQKQTGCLLFVIGAAMLAFVLTDVLKNGPGGLTGGGESVGEIAGETVSYQELMEGVEELKVIYQGSQIDEASLREQAWNQIIQERIIKTEHRELGITMSESELEDALFVNPDPMVIRNFTNPQTNQFDPAMLRDFLEVQILDDPDKYNNYMNFLENPLREMRDGQKYEGMVAAGIYSTKLDAEAEFKKESEKVAAMVVGLPYTLISDSTIEYDDGDLKKFLSENASDYKQLATRDIDFVVMNIFASAEDTAYTRKTIEEYKEEFKKTKRDSSFVMAKRSSRPYTGEYVRRGSSDLPKEVEDFIYSADSGSVSDIIFSDGSFGLYKVLGTKEDSVSLMRARHVLVPVGDDSEAEARKIMADIRAGRTSFEEAAKDNFDRSGTNGGDLGWIQKEGFNILVPQEVKDKVLESNKGDMFVVKSTKGYHVVEVTDGPFRKLVKFAAIVKPVVPGEVSDREVERLAGEIQYRAQNEDDFVALSEEQGQNVREAKKIALGNPTVPGVTDATEIARWLFNDKTRVGDVSDVIALPDRYIVAKCTGIREKGTAKLDDVRDEVIQAYVRNEKGALLAERLNDALAKSTDPEAVASAVNSTASLAPAVNMMAAQVAGIGAEPKVAGTVLGLKEGQHSSPIKGTGGVYVVWNKGAVETGEEGNFNADDLRLQMTERTKGQMGDIVLDALRDKGNIVDKRYNFF